MSKKQPAANKEAPPLPSLRAVEQYLQAKGYLVSKSAIARAVRTGKLAFDGGPRPRDRVYPRHAVDQYARTYLVAADGLDPDTPASEQVQTKQAEKLAAQVRREQAAARKLELEVKQLEGKLVPVAKVEQEVLKRIFAFMSLYRAGLPLAVRRWVQAVRDAADQAAAESLLMEMVTDYYDDHIAGLAKAPVVEIPIKEIGRRGRPKSR